MQLPLRMSSDNKHWAQNSPSLLQQPSVDVAATGSISHNPRGSQSREPFSTRQGENVPSAL
eukprot:223234-Amphidinium_carterae.1